jgi:hypothetical protein
LRVVAELTWLIVNIGLEIMQSRSRVIRQSNAAEDKPAARIWVVGHR